MSKTDTTHALALISSSELKVTNENLERLQQSVIEQFRKLNALRGEEALRGLLLGLTLHRVKASLPYGEFGPWAEQHACFGKRWVSYLMKLALVFIDSSKVTKPEFLALPGDQTELRLDDLEGVQRSFYTKAMKFVGDASLNELLCTHGIKDAKKLGGERTTGTGTEAPKPAPTPEQMAHMTRDEIGEAINRVELLLIKESRLAYVAGDHDFLRGVASSLGDLALKVDGSVRELISISKPAAKAPVTVEV